MSKKDKKKKIKENIKNMDPMYDHETNLKIADSLENEEENLEWIKSTIQIYLW